MTALLDVRDLRVSFPVRTSVFGSAKSFVAVDGVSFSISPGTTFALVGESGSGKTTVARALLRVHQHVTGEVHYGEERQDVLRLTGRGLNAYRRQVQAVFQDPFSSLDPRMQVLEIVSEPLRVAGVRRAARHATARDLLQRVGIPAGAERGYPHEFSGGQRQRIAIARALALRPRLIILDEPVSSLDVSVRAQVLNLLMDLQAEYATSYLLIAHDIGVVRSMSEQIGIMYRGRIVEMGATNTVLSAARHPYTRQLLEAAEWGADESKELGPDDVGEGSLAGACSFVGRCAFRARRCEVDDPVLRGSDELVACHFPLPPLRSGASNGTQRSS